MAAPWYHYDVLGAFCLGPPPGSATAPRPAASSPRAGGGDPRPAAVRLGPAAAPARKVARHHCRATANPARVFRTGLANVLRGPMEDLKGAMQRTRGKGALKERQHVKVVLSGLSRGDEQRALREHSQATMLSDHRVTAIGQYTVYCAQKGTGPVLPITGDMAKGFLAWSVVKEPRPVASHTLGGVLSNLRVAATAMGKWGVTAKDELELKSLIKSLQETIPSLPRRTAAVPVAAVVAACERLRRDGSLQAMQTRAMLAGAMGTLARGKEVGGESGMRWGDLQMDYRGLAFKAYLCKTGKASLAARIRICPHMPKELEAICPSRCLLEFKALWQDKGGVAAQDDLVWRSVSKAGLPTSAPLSTASATALVRDELVKEQVPSAMIDAHWARHTGRHLLKHELGFGGDGADFMGDWAPPSKGSRKKSVGETNYAHLSVDEMWEEVMESYIPPGYAARCCKR